MTSLICVSNSSAGFWSRWRGNGFPARARDPSSSCPWYVDFYDLLLKMYLVQMAIFKGCLCRLQV
jgi:hypothetical protein